jgi:enoyl-CoA hydratase
MVICSKKDAVATITLSRPNAGNCITTRVVAELKDLRRDIRRDKTVRVVVITGDGQDVFCAGTDLAEFNTFENRENRIELFSAAAIIAAFECPTIAAINGNAFGQGLEVALACDLRICSQNAAVGMPQVSDGEMPWDGGTQRLTRLVGRGKALELLLFGETIDAREAQRIGLVHKAVAHAELMTVVKDVAHKMAVKSPISLAYVKEAIHKGMDLTLEQGLRLEADLYYLIHTSRDRNEGIRAFREKRRPQFEGK